MVKMGYETLSCSVRFRKYGILFIFLFSFVFNFDSYGHDLALTDSLLVAARSNLQKLHGQPQEAYATAVKIEEDARELQLSEAEMWALITQCEFFEFNNDFSRLFQAALRFYNRAGNSELPVFQAVAKYYLYHSYYYNQMHEKALLQLDEGIALLENADQLNPVAARAKRNLLTAYSNYYAAKKDYKNQIYYLELIIESAQAIKDTSARNRVYYIHFANLASAYFNTNELESAQEYLQKSESYKTEPNENVEFLNHMTRGKIAAQNGRHEFALEAYRAALNADTGYVNSYNKIELYDYMVRVWNEMQMPDSAMYYSLQRDAFQSGVLKKRNEFLYDLATGNEAHIGPAGAMNYKFLILGICVLFILAGWYVNRNNMNKAVMVSQNGAATVANAEYNMAMKATGFTNLIQMLEENNPAFSAYFDKVFPNFTPNILNINNDINQSEIEFCQLLKLKLSSKEIATYKFISPKTVQNKKYLIRKKMNIPKNMDIYHWFDKF